MLNIYIIDKLNNFQTSLLRIRFGGFGGCLPDAKSFQPETDPEINSGRPRLIFFQSSFCGKFVNFTIILSQAMKCNLLILAV
jgi:hypothetical protein